MYGTCYYAQVLVDKLPTPKAINEFCTHLSWYHTPAPMSSIIIDWLQQWLSGNQPTIVLQPTNDEDPNANFHRLINEAHSNQSTIRWGLFVQGWIASAWQWAIVCYYHETQLGRSYNPALWARKTIDKCEPHFEPSGYAAMENYMEKTTKNSNL
jgi:hypothetical protein